jgi:hypothetical protein
MIHRHKRFLAWMTHSAQRNQNSYKHEHGCRGCKPPPIPNPRPSLRLRALFFSGADELARANHGRKLLAAPRAVGEVQFEARGFVRIKRALRVCSENFRIRAGLFRTRRRGKTPPQ